MNPTEAQRRAIESDASEILVVAGPGSGKTATTVKRIHGLIQMGTNPLGIVALTFTNAAADELSKRIAVCPNCGGDGWTVEPDRHGEPEQIQCPCGGSLRIGYCGTLHGFALRMLKQHGRVIGYGESISIVGEEAAADLLASKAKALGCKTPIKQLLKMKADVRNSSKLGRMSDDERVIRSYYADLREGGMVDFDTILTAFLELLRKEIAEDLYAGEEMGKRFTHLFVDEVQDSAEIDWAIYNELKVANKFYVGDADQSIYAFRGGRPDLMRKKAESPGVMVTLLQENFRSHAEICWAAQRLIEQNKDRIPKATLSVKGDGGAINVYRGVENSGAECALIVDIVRMVASQQREVPFEAKSSPVPTAADYAEIAVLARTNAICYEVREQLKASGIPVAEEAKPDVPSDWGLAKAAVELLVNPANDTLAYFYVIAKQRKNGAADFYARGAADDARRNARSLLIPMNRRLGLFLGGPYSLADVGMLLAQEAISNESRMRVAQIMRKLDAGSDLLQLALAMGQEHGEPAAVVGVTVTTLHGAKGREWDSVILAGFEDEILPSGRGDVEESRRLAYVGVTRARKRLYITHSTSRRTEWGALERHTPSRFIKEMGL